MKLPLEEQQFLLCVHEECELWQVLSAIASVIPIREGQLEPARRILLKYMDKGWVSLARGARDAHGRWAPKPLAGEEARRIIMNDHNWELPSEVTPDDVGSVITILSPEGDRALEAGAAADAFARIPKGPSS